MSRPVVLEPLHVRRPTTFWALSGLWAVVTSCGLGLVSFIGWWWGAALSRRPWMVITALIHTVVNIGVIVGFVMVPQEYEPGHDAWLITMIVVYLVVLSATWIHVGIALSRVRQELRRRADDLYEGRRVRAGLSAPPAPASPPYAARIRQPGARQHDPRQHDLRQHAPGQHGAGQPDPRQHGADPGAPRPQTRASDAVGEVFDAEAGRFFDCGTSSSASAAAPPATPVDVNSATPQELIRLPGVSAPLVRRLIETRRAAGGFRDFGDVVAKTGMQPHELLGLRRGVTYGTFRDHYQPGYSDEPGGRVLDV